MGKVLQGLVYLSPLPWSSFEQRPHKFVRWFHLRTGGKVLWIDPYPTRLPKLSDLKRFRMSENSPTEVPEWLEVVRPNSLPIEPILGSGVINRLIWRNTLIKILEFSNSCNIIVALGKPSALANQVLDMLPGVLSLYDAMDDFPAFYAGISQRAMKAMMAREAYLIEKATTLVVSSTTLYERWVKMRPDVKLIPNGLDIDTLPSVELRTPPSRPPYRFGYVGTIGAWFDWSWLIELAKSRPNDEFLIVGPILSGSPYEIPLNIKLKPACKHSEAVILMQTFDVGLIPFVCNKLTSSVDPIKYYEYRALGVPVLSTAFGEMLLRISEPGTFISESLGDVAELASQALHWTFTKNEIEDFAEASSWSSRFDTLELF